MPDLTMTDTHPSHIRMGEVTCTAVLVLGVHRSGTSMLTGLLEKLGVSMPATLMEPNAANARGFFESVPVMDLNDAMMEAGGTNWKAWTSMPKQWERSADGRRFAEDAETVLVAEFGDAPLLALKDPRICRLVPVWSAALTRRGYRTVVVNTLRHPLEVAASLSRRDGFSNDINLLLWLRDTLDSERASRDLPRIFVRYDDIVSDPGAALAKIGNALDIKWPVSVNAAKLSDFTDVSLRHFTAGNETADPSAVPDMVRDTFEILVRWAAEGETTRDHAWLDSIKTEFDAMTPMLTALLSDRAEKTGELKALRQERDTLRHQIGKRDQDISILQHGLETARRELGAARAAMRESETQRSNAENDRAAAVRRAQQLAAQLETLAQRGRTQSAADAAAADTARAAKSALDTERTARRAAETRIAELSADLTRVAEDRRALLTEVAALRRVVNGTGAQAKPAAPAERAPASARNAERRLAAERDDLYERLRQSENDRNALLSSTSWRVTAPLRRLVGDRSR